ncbi:MAG: hypothetical protein ACOYJK_02025 [Prevotella sp.]|jgi:hypothetical protein
MEKKIYLAPAIRMKSMESETIMAASGPTSVTGEASTESVTDGYADSKQGFYDLWEDDYE